MSSQSWRTSKLQGRQWSDWGPWLLSKAYSRHYRQRQDVNGNIETTWRLEGEGNDDSGGAGLEKHGEEQTGGDKENNESERGVEDVCSKPGYEWQVGDTVGPEKTEEEFQGYGTGPASTHYEAYTVDYDDNEARSYGSGTPCFPVRFAKSDVDYDGENRQDDGERGRHQVMMGHPQGTTSHEFDQNPNRVASESDQSTSSNWQNRFDFSGKELELVDLDPRFRVEPGDKFQPGEVFKIISPEPSRTGTSISDQEEVRDPSGGRSLCVGSRRFIVVANDSGHCTCLPIHSYSGKGCKKRGVKPQKHGIITEMRRRPRLLENEPSLGFPPIRMVVEVDGEALGKEYRVNYSKLVTVEHNVKVFFIGHVYPDDYERVADAVNNCWEDCGPRRKGRAGRK